MNETAKNQWNGEYPIFIEWKDQYEWTQFDIMHDEAQLIEFCDSHQLNPRELIYLNAQPIYACDGVFIDADELRFQGIWMLRFRCLLMSLRINFGPLSGLSCMSR